MELVQEVAREVALEPCLAQHHHRHHHHPHHHHQQRHYHHQARHQTPNVYLALPPTHQSSTVPRFSKYTETLCPLHWNVSPFPCVRLAPMPPPYLTSPHHVHLPVTDPLNLESGATFAPEYAHQVFGEGETIVGYASLAIRVCYTADTLHTVVVSSFRARLHEQARPDNYVKMLVDNVGPC